MQGRLSGRHCENQRVDTRARQLNAYRDEFGYAVGIPELVAKCVQLARPRGHALIVGVSPRQSPLPVDLFDMHFREVSVRGAFGCGNSFLPALELLPQIDLENVVGGRYPLDEIDAAFATSAAGEGVKFMMAPHD